MCRSIAEGGRRCTGQCAGAAGARIRQQRSRARRALEAAEASGDQTAIATARDKLDRIPSARTGGRDKAQAKDTPKTKRRGAGTSKRATTRPGANASDRDAPHRTSESSTAASRPEAPDHQPANGSTDTAARPAARPAAPTPAEPDAPQRPTENVAPATRQPGTGRAEESDSDQDAGTAAPSSGWPADDIASAAPAGVTTTASAPRTTSPATAEATTPDRPTTGTGWPIPEPRDAVEEEVRDTVQSVATSRGSETDWVAIVEVFERLPHLNRDQIHKALNNMRKDQHVQFAPDSNRKALRDEDHAAAITIADEPMHLLCIEKPIERGGSNQVIAAGIGNATDDELETARLDPLIEFSDYDAIRAEQRRRGGR